MKQKKFCYNCDTEVVPKTFYKQVYAWGDDGNPYRKQVPFTACPHCEEYIHTYPCQDWIEDKSCSRCRSIDAERKLQASIFEVLKPQCTSGVHRPDLNGNCVYCGLRGIGIVSAQRQG